MPISYSKVQREIQQILYKIDATEDEREIGFSNEKQKRMYKNELLQESYQNKLGLVNKPSMSQLMIGDFIREQSNKATKLQSLGNDLFALFIKN